MNHPNPFVPQGSLLEQQSKRRSRMKLAVLCVSVFGAAGLILMLIQGCKREQTESQNQPPVDTNTVAAVDTNPPPMVASNPPVPPPPVAPPPPPVVENPGTEYVVVAHDTLGKISKKNGVTLKALEAANPGVNPNKLKVGQKLTIPPGGSAPAASETGMAGGETYVVKSGDNLTKIARAHGTTPKAIKAENNLTTDHIKVGQRLKIPAKAEVAAPAAAPAPAPAPMTPQPPPPGPAPAPAGTPSGQ